MGASIFEITEHVVPCQHIREYARATIQPDGPLDLVIKQYTPKSNPDPQPGDVTIIATHGSGFPKVPLFITTSTVGIVYELIRYRNFTNHFSKRSAPIQRRKTSGFAQSGLQTLPTKGLVVYVTKRILETIVSRRRAFQPNRTLNFEFQHLGLTIAATSL